MNDQHRALAVLGDGGDNAAEEDVGDTRAATRTDHDQVRPLLVGGFDDQIPGLPPMATSGSASKPASRAAPCSAISWALCSPGRQLTRGFRDRPLGEIRAVVGDQGWRRFVSSHDGRPYLAGSSATSIRPAAAAAFSAS